MKSVILFNGLKKIESDSKVMDTFQSQESWWMCLHIIGSHVVTKLSWSF
jgi:hypothetical protein